MYLIMGTPNQHLSCCVFSLSPNFVCVSVFIGICRLCASDFLSKTYHHQESIIITIYVRVRLNCVYVSWYGFTVYVHRCSS